MPERRKPHVAKSHDAASDLMAALGRLRRGQPLHPQLAALNREGRMRISIASVAKEANRSRTLVGSDGCTYPEVRKEIMAAAAVGASSPTLRSPKLTAQELIASLREENAILRHEKAMLATRVQDALNVARALERKMAQAERRASRSEARLSHPEQVVGRASRQGNVVPIREDD